MTKHIMLMFLSDIKTIFDKDTKTVSISKGKYDDLHDGFGLTESTNESAIRYLLQEGWNGAAIDTIERVFLFASDKVREELVADWSGQYPYIEEGKTYTHLDFFKYRLEKSGILTNIRKCLPDDVIYRYDEKAPMDQTMNMATAMADKIQKYISSLQGEEVVLHVDLSGGMRHVSMMMLELMRLMEYNQVQIGKVLYSNFDSHTKAGKVEEATSIYQFFNLISGAEEFVRFGSVSAILDYYQGQDNLEKSQELQSLLDAMEGFAEEIRLCHRGNFEKAILQLRSAIRAFQESEKTLSGDILMSQMMRRIAEEYKGLVGMHWDALESIQWCLEHGYLQQALTLYTETIPLYLFEQKYVELTEEGRREIEEQFQDDKRDMCFIALNEYDVRNTVDLADNAWKERYTAELPKILLAITEEQAKGAIDAKLYKLLKEKVQSVDIEDINVYVGKYTRCVVKIIKALLAEKMDAQKAQEIIYQQMREFTIQYPSVQYDNQIHFVTSLLKVWAFRNTPRKIMTVPDSWVFKIIEEYKASKDYVSDEKWNSLDVFKRANCLRGYMNGKLSQSAIIQLFGSISLRYSSRPCRLIDKEKLIIHIERENFCKIMDRYGYLKNIRNSSNHARNDDEYISADDLKAYMETGVKELKEIGNK